MTKPRSAPSPSFTDVGRTGHIVAHNGGRGFGGGEGLGFGDRFAELGGEGEAAVFE